MENKTETKKEAKTPSSLHQFDTLPDAAQVRIGTVQKLLACSRSTAWRLVKSGVLKPKKFSERVTTFNVGELRELLAKGQPSQN
jgi:predicted DNA-binding transcriptional regulator AlpA